MTNIQPHLHDGHSIISSETFDKLYWYAKSNKENILINKVKYFPHTKKWVDLYYDDLFKKYDDKIIKIIYDTPSYSFFHEKINKEIQYDILNDYTNFILYYNENEELLKEVILYGVCVDETIGFDWSINEYYKTYIKDKYYIRKLNYMISDSVYSFLDELGITPFWGRLIDKYNIKLCSICNTINDNKEHKENECILYDIR